MSEAKFNEAKSSLAFSQSLIERLRQEQSQAMMPPMSEEMPTQDAPIEEEVIEETPVESPAEEQDEKKGIIEGVVDALKPMFDKLMNREEPKEVEIKIDGEMKPKEEPRGE